MIKKKMDAILKTQDINALKAMIDDGFTLDNFDLPGILTDFINNKEKIDSRFIKYLIDNGIKLEHISKKQNTNFMLLAYLGLDEIVDDFISKGFDINATNTFGMNAFHWAIAGGQYTTVKLLMEKGADIYATAEFEVEYRNWDDVTNDNGVKLEQGVKKIKVSSFALAFNEYNPKTIRLLLEKGFDPNEDVIREMSVFEFFQDAPASEYNINDSSISVVVKNNDAELLKLMIEKGVKRFDTSDLAKACKNLNLEIIKLLVETGVDINFDTFSYLNENPLSIACSHSAIDPIKGNCASKLDIHGSEVLEIIKYLIEHGADINVDSPLMAASSFNYPYGSATGNENQFYADVNIDIIKLLIEKGADVNFAHGKNGKNILMEAVNRLNGFELAKIFIEYGADVNYKDESQNTCLHLLLDEWYHKEEYYEDNKGQWQTNKYNGSNGEKILKLLIDNGADINARNNMGMTPLMSYALKEEGRFVKILLENGADINAKSEMTAFDLAQNEEIKALIQKAKNNNPQKLIKILKNFTIDKPIKYTTHDWELFHPNNCEYKNFDGYMDAVKKQFDSMKSDLEELSPNLYKKIHTFLIEENPEPTYSWCQKTHINIGWSSLKGLKEHCDAGKKAENFTLPQPIYFNGEDKTTFKDIIDLFKQEIEIRENFKNLIGLFAHEKKKLGSGRDATFKLDLSASKLDRQFYTDVEKFSGMLSKIFNEIKTRKEFPNITVTTQEMEEDRSIVLRITQIDSFSHCDAQGLLDEVKDGDFAEIKENLKNLCDWSVESSFGENFFRVNYLYSNNVKEIESISEKPKGFTHVLRFYK